MSQELAASHPRPRRQRGAFAAPAQGRLAASAAVLAGALLAGWQGGPAGLLAAAGAGVVMPLLWRRPSTVAGPATAADDASLPRVSGGRVGAEVMVSQVVPVWGRQLDVTQDAANAGLGKLLEDFAALAGTLSTLAADNQAAAVRLDAGALDEAMANGGPARDALQQLLAPSQRAFAQRDAAVAQLARCADALQQLQQLGRQARDLGKHTRLVAFNATVEASRDGRDTGAGAQAVADETRLLSDRIVDVGRQIEQLVTQLERTIAAERLRGELDDTTPDELELELQLQARRALQGLLGGLGGALAGGTAQREAAAELSRQVEALFVGFQFGDRLSQMLAIVANDMHNFAKWVGANPYATQSDAAEWLANLEASYTMDEQRSQHHGNVHIDRGSEIEFF